MLQDKKFKMVKKLFLGRLKGYNVKTKFKKMQKHCYKYWVLF